MITEVIRTSAGRVLVRQRQATRVDPVQAMKVQLATRLGVPVEEIGDARVELELDRYRAEVREQAADRGEEVLGWQ